MNKYKQAFYSSLFLVLLFSVGTLLEAYFDLKQISYNLIDSHRWYSHLSMIWKSIASSLLFKALLFFCLEALCFSLPKRERWILRLAFFSTLFVGYLSGAPLQEASVLRALQKSVVTAPREFVFAMTVTLLAGLSGCVFYWTRKASVLAFLALTLLFVPWPKNFYGHKRGPETKGPPGQKTSQIILSIDGLNTDQLVESARSLNLPHLQRFLREAKFHEMHSPIGMTEPALLSFMSGQDPVDHGLRFALQAHERKVPSSPLRLIKREGTKTLFYYNHGEFMDLHELDLFDRIVGPPHELGSFLENYVWTSALYVAIKDSPIGSILLGERRLDYAYYKIYDAKGFGRLISREIDRQLEKNERFLLFYHTSEGHWPLITDSRGRFELPNSSYRGFASEELYQRRFFELETLNQKLDFNRKFYQMAIDRIARNFLEPFLEDFFLKGRNEGIDLMIVSDHGEYVPSKTYAGSVFPLRHGVSLLADDFSTTSALIIRKADSGPPYKIPEQLSFRDLGRVIWASQYSTSSETHEGMEYAPIAQESTLWRQRIVGLPYRGPSLIESTFTIDFETKRLKFNDNYFESLLVSKQRAIIEGSYRLTLFPTQSGYRLFLCNFKDDKECRQNLFKDDFATARALFNKLKKIFEADQSRGVLPIFGELSEADNTVPICQEESCLESYSPHLLLHILGGLDGPSKTRAARRIKALRRHHADNEHEAVSSLQILEYVPESDVGIYISEIEEYYKTCGRDCNWSALTGRLKRPTPRLRALLKKLEASQNEVLIHLLALAGRLNQDVFESLLKAVRARQIDPRALLFILNQHLLANIKDLPQIESMWRKLESVTGAQISNGAFFVPRSILELWRTQDLSRKRELLNALENIVAIDEQIGNRQVIKSYGSLFRAITGLEMTSLLQSRKEKPTSRTLGE